MTHSDDIDALLDAGTAHHEAGRTRDAETLYRQVLAQEPDHADALNMLGVLLQDTGRLDDSIAVLTRAAVADPEFPEALTNLARAQCAAGDMAGAKHSSQQAIDLDPDLADAYLQLARAHLGLDEHAAAETAATRAAALTPGSADARLFLGHAHSRAGNFPAAAEAYRAAEVLAPDRFEIVLNRGATLMELGRFDDAIAQGRRAVAMAPEDPSGYAALGETLRRAGDIAGSVEALGQTLKYAPDHAAVWRKQGDNFVFLGRFDEAAACYHRVLALDPGSPDTLSCLAGIGRLTNADEQRGRLHAAMADPQLRRAERLAAGYALGDLLDKAGDHVAAFSAYASVNRLAAETADASAPRFDRRQFRDRIDALRAAFPPPVFATTADWGDPSEAPVFIVGMPRTGTSLVEQILASHPDVHGAGERTDIPDIARRLEAAGALAIRTRWDSETIRREAAAQLARLRRLGGTATRVIDKMPDNILLLGHIAVLFPNARIIVCRRDLRDVCLSCFFQNFNDDLPWTRDLADCATRASEVERLLAHWRAVLPSRMIEVDYETLVGDLEGESKRLVSFLGLEWNEACLSYDRNERVVRTASLWQVRQPIYTSSMERWRNYLLFIGPLLAGLAGKPDEPAIGASALFTVGDFAGAAEAAAATLEVHPTDATAQFILGAAHLSLGDSASAQTALARAIELAPDSPEAHLHLGMACILAGDLPAAAIALRTALTLKPGDPEVLAKLGRVLGELRQYNEALPLLREAVAQAPKDGRTHLALLTILWQAHDIAGLEAARGPALKAAPDLAELWLYSGYCDAALGRFQEAAEAYRQALALDPKQDMARIALVRTGRHGATLAEPDRLRGILMDPDRVMEERISAGHALGDLLDRETRFDAAWDAYATANALSRAYRRSRGRGFDPVAFERHRDALMANFTKSTIPAMAGFGNPSERPVFVVGMPRSGTTLVEQIASSHPEVHGAGELDDITAIAFGLGGQAGTLLQDPAKIALEAARYLAKLDALGQGARLVIDKMPDNAQWLGYIAVLFPRARVVICRRDPRDVGLSCFFRDFGDSLPWSTDLEDIALKSRGFEQLAAHWRSALKLPILEVEYEKLVGDLEGESRRLIVFLGLEWDPSCLAFHKNERVVMTASQWQVRQPIYSSSVGRWRHFQRHLRPLIAGLGDLAHG